MQTQVKIELTINGEGLQPNQLRNLIGDVLAEHFNNEYVNRYGNVDDIHLSLNGQAGLSIDCQG